MLAHPLLGIEPSLKCGLQTQWYSIESEKTNFPFVSACQLKIVSRSEAGTCVHFPFQCGTPSGLDLCRSCSVQAASLSEFRSVSVLRYLVLSSIPTGSNTLLASTSADALGEGFDTDVSLRIECSPVVSSCICPIYHRKKSVVMVEVDTDLISSCCLQDALKPFTELSESATYLIRSFYLPHLWYSWKFCSSNKKHN